MAYDVGKYWKGKEGRAIRAAEAREEREIRLADEIRRSALGTRVYDARRMGPEFTAERPGAEAPETVFLNVDSTSAVLAASGRRVAVLNFASAKNPGGAYLKGSSAQEESLCRESDLFEILSRFDGTYYAESRRRLNGSLYDDLALYVPDVVFERKDASRVAGVITCAAPNRTAALKYGRATEAENDAALVSRIAHVKAVAENEEVDELILGAFGCGVFGQDPRRVAEIMRETFARTTVGRIVHAVPGDDENARTFREIFG